MIIVSNKVVRIAVICNDNDLSSFSAVFLIPYFTMLVIEGIPLFLVELWIGQKFRAGCIGGFYKIHKALSKYSLLCLDSFNNFQTRLCVKWDCVQASQTSNRIVGEHVKTKLVTIRHVTAHGRLA